jgi:sulfate permease, SulP family
MTTTTDTHNSKTNSTFKRYIPLLSWLPNYNRGWLAADVIAGLTLWGLVVPEAMAYAGIAGLPPQAGLYTLVVALLIYAFMGTSRHLVMQATSATAALLASGVAGAMLVTAVANPTDPATYQAYASAFVLVTSLVFLVAGLAKLGFITQFLSKPVMDGFIMGLALFVAVGQLNKLFGVPKPSGNTVEKLLGIIESLPEANWVAFAMGAGAMALLFILPHFSKKIPAGLVVLFGAIALSAALDLNGAYEVEIVGSLPQGLPSFAFPVVPLSAYFSMVLPAIGVLLVAYSESLGVAQEFAEKNGYEVDADQELNAHAIANLFSGLFGGMLAAGSMSASAVKAEAGARTQVTNLVTWVATIITLLFLTPLFTTLPEAVLGALIIHALWHILSSRKLQKLREASPVEFWFGMLALLGVIFIDVLQGMVIGLVASLLFVIYRSSRPHIAVLGRVPSAPGAYSDVNQHPENIQIPGILILRLNGVMYYANARTVRNQIKGMVTELSPAPRAIIIDAAVQEELDVTSTAMLRSLFKELQGMGIKVYLAEVQPPVLAYGEKVGFLDFIGNEQIFPSVDTAVRHLENNATPTN